MTSDEIKALRARLGLTQVQFAARLGVSPTTVAKWETIHRSPSPLALEKLRALQAGELPCPR